MKKITNLRLIILACFFILAANNETLAQKAAQPELAYTVSMDNPTSNTYQVSLKCNGLTAKQYDFKMPVWMPGYYQDPKLCQ
ncbi:hypothetical protein [Pedobacter sp. UC225_65]|uniref:M61 family metallopeptidase n=1 Tax=Pedobacter sp. UC225_65 TaxID=3350173 RepID=UPI00366CC645